MRTSAPACRARSAKSRLLSRRVSSLQAWMYSGGNPARPAYKGLTKGSRGFPGFARKFLCWHAGLP